uniref:Replication protein A subunit n=1 Tax=Cyanoptyche gloeocystis TaxID=77922 RepID=A0A7S2JN56_9EUKA|mmetsp:Transcript_2405/g.4419  ORF Transcript_2405/g.4419 Transcript_2405/m.4419 type:complete len:671 (+) Transcript_2405:58-2070(+)
MDEGSNFKLEGGVVQLLMHGHAEKQPLLQVLDVKRIGNPGAPQGDRYRLQLSDGVFFTQSMLATQLNDLVANGELQQHCVVQLTEHICNVVQNRKIIIALGMIVKSGPVPVIGNPRQLESPPITSDGVTGGNNPGQYQQNNPKSSFQQSSYQSVPGNQNQNPNQNQPSYQQQQKQQNQSHNNPSNRQMPNSAPQQRNAAAVAPSYSGGMQSNRGASIAKAEGSLQGIPLTPISALNPYNNRWTIKARVTNKGDIKTYSNARGSGKILNVVFLDEEGGEIRATMFNDTVDKLNPVFELNGVYLVSKGTLKPANKQFSRGIKHEYEMTLDDRATVERISDDPSIGSMKWSFVKISQIEQINNNEVVDVIGVVIDIGHRSEITTKSKGNQLSRRNLKLADDSDCSVELTLWGDKAEDQQWDDFMAQKHTPILACRHVRVSDFNGRSLSSTSDSGLFVDPDNIAEAGSLRFWFDSRNPTQHLSSVSSAGGGRGGQAERKLLSAIKDEDLGNKDKADVFSAKATVVFIKHDSACWYPSCPDDSCKKKVTGDENNGWRCEKCDKSYDRPKYRYMLSLSLNDSTAGCWVSAFGDDGTKILGLTADDLQALKENNPAEYDRVFSEALFKSYIFKIKAKMETYNDESRVKLSVLAIDPMDFRSETTRMLDSIRAMGIMF